MALDIPKPNPLTTPQPSFWWWPVWFVGLSAAQWTNGCSGLRTLQLSGTLLTVWSILCGFTAFLLRSWKLGHPSTRGKGMKTHNSVTFLRHIFAGHIWLLIKIPLSRNGHSSRINILLSRNFRELHVYLSRGPCWPTTPLMKIRSPPAKLRQRITDHFLVAF